MSRTLFTALAAVVLIVPLARATDVNLTCVAVENGSSAITVGPGDPVAYSVGLELGDSQNQGLAAVFFDLAFTGGALPQADTPVDPISPMIHFAPPLGFSNPDGYGGTVIDGVLVQVGGAQNVLMHGEWTCETNEDCPAPSTCAAGLCTTVAGLPVGTVLPDLAGPGNPVVVVTGTLTAPTTPGTYALQIDNVVASVLEFGARGKKYWATDPAGVGTVVDLSVTVETGEVEACCLSSGACTVVPALACDQELGGIPQGPGTVCEGDLDGDGVDGLCGDGCPNDEGKLAPGICGCGSPDVDSDGDTVLDCFDQCPGEDDTIDENGNGIPDCVDANPVPTVSFWGFAILALMLLVAAKLFWRGWRQEARGISG